MRDYTKIEAWRLADDLTVAVYERTRSFPREEIYGLTSQMHRAAFSIPANIVEGASREQERLPSLSLYCARLARYQRLNISFTSRGDSITCRQRKLIRYSNKRRQRLPVCTVLFGQSKRKRENSAKWSQP
jgi:23S rRNA-intervening sequence protein